MNSLYKPVKSQVLFGLRHLLVQHPKGTIKVKLWDDIGTIV